MYATAQTLPRSSRPYAVVIDDSEIPLIPTGTTFPSHEAASSALTLLASLMPEEWHGSTYRVRVGEICTGLRHLYASTKVDTAHSVRIWLKDAETHKLNTDATKAQGSPELHNAYG